MGLCRHVDIKAKTATIELAIEAEHKLSALPGGIDPTLTYVSGDTVCSERDLELSAEVPEITLETAEAYKATCHTCDHRITDRRQAGGCRDMVVLGEQGDVEMSTEEAI